MFLTVTANSALDRVLFVDRFVPGTTMRPKRMVESVGGKGFDTSVVLRALGQKTLALGFVAGLTGKALVALLDDYGIDHDLLWVDGETRISHVIVETEYNRHSHLTTAGYSIPPAAYTAVLEKVCQHASHAKWIIAAGSLPEGVPSEFYQTLVRIGHEGNIPSLIDCPGTPALQAVLAGPTILKMNQSEFGETFGISSKSVDQLVNSAIEVWQQYTVQSLVITCGERGILALTPQGCFHAISPEQIAVNAAGAGDGASACLAWRLSQGDSWPRALHWAAATSAAVVLTEGTADCNFKDVQRIYPDVRMHQLNPRGT